MWYVCDILNITYHKINLNLFTNLFFNVLWGISGNSPRLSPGLCSNMHEVWRVSAELLIGKCLEVDRVV